MGRSSGKASKKGLGRTAEETDLANQMFRDDNRKKSLEIKDGDRKKAGEVDYALCGCCPAGLVVYPQSVGDVLSTNCHQAFKENFEMFLRKQKDKNKSTSRYFKLKHEQRMGFACLTARFCTFKGASEESKKKGTHLFSTIDKWADDLLEGFEGAETLLACLKDIANGVPRAPTQQVIQKVVINQPGTRPGDPGSQIIVPLQTLQNLKPGEGISTGQPGHLLIKTETGQYQILRVGPPDSQSPTSTAMQPYTSTPVQPYTSTTVQTSTSTALQPSTSTAVQPSTNTVVQPSTSSAVQLSTSTTVQPSTNTSVQPSTNTAAQPSTNTAAQPSTSTAVLPSTNTAVLPSTNTAAQPSTSTAVQPSTNTAVQPSTNTAVQLSTSTAVQPSTNTAVLPSTNTAAQPSTSTAAQLSTISAVQLSTSTPVQLSTSTAVQLSTSTAVQPSTSNAAQPSTNTAVQPSANTTVQPPTSPIVQPHTSNTVQPSSSTTVQSSTGATVQPSTNSNTVQYPTSTTVQPPTGTTVQPPASTTVQLPTGTTVQPPASTTVQLPTGTTVQSTTSPTVQSITSPTVQPTTSATLQPSTSNPVQLPTGTTVQSTTSATVQPTTSAAVQPSTSNPVQLPTGTTVQSTTSATFQHSVAAQLPCPSISTPVPLPTWPAVVTSTPVSSASAPPVTSTAATSAASSLTITPDEGKVKCKNLLSALLHRTSDQPELVVRSVQLLIQGVIDGMVEPEMFMTKLQKVLKDAPPPSLVPFLKKPSLVPFLKKYLPYLQHSLSKGELSIEGIVSPTISQVAKFHSAVSAPPVKAPTSLPRAPLDISVISEESYKDVKGLVISAHKWMVKQLDEVLEEFKQFRDGLEEKERKNYDNLVQEQNEEWRDFDSGKFSFEAVDENIKEIQKKMDYIITRHNNQNKDIDTLVDLIEGKRLDSIPKKKKEKVSKIKTKKNQEKEGKDANNNENIGKKVISTLQSNKKSETSTISIKNVISDDSNNENIGEKDISTLQSDENLEQCKSEMSISIKNVKSDEEITSLSNKAKSKKKKNQEKECKDANNNETISLKVISTLQSDEKLEHLKSETSFISTENVKSDEEKISLSNKAKMKKNQENECNNENIDERDISAKSGRTQNVKSDAVKAKMADELKKAMAAVNITKAKLEETENQLRAERSKNRNETAKLNKAMEALNTTKAKLEKTENRLRADQSKSNHELKKAVEALNTTKAKLEETENQLRAERSKNADEPKKAVEALNKTKAKLEETEDQLRAERSKNAYENNLLKSKLLFNDFKKHCDVLRQRQKNNFSLIDHLRASPEMVQTPEVQMVLRSLHEFSAQLLLADQELSRLYTTLCQQLQTTNTIPELSLDMSSVEPPDLGSSCMSLLYQSILMSHTSPTFPSFLTSSPLGSSLPVSHTRDGTQASRVTIPLVRSQGIGSQLPTESIGSVISNGATATSFPSSTATAKIAKPRADQKKLDKITKAFLKRGGGDATDNPEDTSCSICFEVMDESNSFYLKLCSHRFHTACLERWLQSPRGVSSTCPMCRAYISKENQFSNMKDKTRL